MKKFSIIITSFLLLTSSAFAMKVVNLNSLDVSVAMLDTSCRYQYDVHNVPAHHYLNWTFGKHGEYPPIVCVELKGWSGKFLYAKNIHNTPLCKITISDAGFLNGIQAEVGLGC